MKTLFPQDNWYISHKTQIREDVSLSVIGSLLLLEGAIFIENGTYSRKAEMRRQRIQVLATLFDL
jgi:hypothetical protein